MRTDVGKIGKRTMAAAVIAAVLVSGGSVAAVAADPPTRVMWVGDSILNGSAGDWTIRYCVARHVGAAADFVGPYDGVAYPGVGQTLDYVDPAFDRQHDAVSGRAAFQEKDVIAGKVTAFDPAVLIVNLGTNDLGWYGRSAQQAVNDLMWLVISASFAPKATPGLSFVLTALPPQLLGGASYETKRVEFNSRLATLVADWQAIGVNVRLVTLAGFDARADNRDGLHPAPRGEVRYAAGYADALATLGIGTPYGPLTPHCGGGS
jgi:hypothetical protein